MGSELVFDIIMHFHPDLNPVVSLVSKKYYDIDSLTRKHVTVHVHFLPDPQRISRRFPNIESLTLKSYSYGEKSYLYGDQSYYEQCRRFHPPMKCSFPLTPWVEEVAKLGRLNSVSVRNMVVSAYDFKSLAKTLGARLTSLEIIGCKLFSDDGLDDIVRACVGLRSLRLEYNAIESEIYFRDGEWLRELASCNTGVLESIAINHPFDHCNVSYLTLLAKKCIKSLVSLNAISYSPYIYNYQEFFKHANKLERFAYVAMDIGWYSDSDCSDFRFPPNIRGLCIDDWREDTFPFLLPCLHQLRELDLRSREFQSVCQCYLFERCPNLEVLRTKDSCGDIGCHLIGQFCKKLRKLKHGGGVTHLGLMAIAQGCPDLEYLEVSLIDISNEALECVGTHLHNLRHFRNSWASEDGRTYSLIIDNGVRAMLMGCSKLERLDFGLCAGGLTDMGFGYVGKYGHNLRSISLRHTTESDIGLRELLKGCTKLRKLKLSGCPFNEEAMSSFVFNINQSVRYVWLEYDSPDDGSVLTRPEVSAEFVTRGMSMSELEDMARKWRYEWSN